MNVTKQEFEFMVQSVTTDLLTILTEEKHFSISRAFDILYQSNIYAKLLDEKTGLYYQSPRYIFSYLEDEKQDEINNNVNDIPKC